MADIFKPFQEHKAYLDARGIDTLARDKLRIESTGPSKLTELGFKYPPGVQSALLIPAFNLNGEIEGYGARLFYAKTFDGVSRAKYVSRPNGQQPPSLHFPPLVNWDYLEYGQRVYICESYIKASLLAKLGYHAIGISGCWGWSFKSEVNRNLLSLDWAGGLEPVVFFDSNVKEDNPKLWNAVKRFQAALESKTGRKARIIILPPPEEEGKDWGCDDYFKEHGPFKLKELLDGEAQYIPNDLDAHLVQLNSEVCVIRDVGKFADLDRNILMSRGQFEDVNYADRKALNADEKLAPVAKVWTQWPGRTIVDTLKYKPGMERLVRSDDIGGDYFNLWRGWGTDPVAGDCSLFTEWVEDAFPSESERTYFLDWWAYQIQHPGVKLNTAVMLVGPSGVGKGWMASIAERIFGNDNTWKCNLSDLESRFNSGLGAAQLLVIEEADVAGGVKVYNTLKDLITNEHIRYERKGVDAVKLDNCLNIFLNSNHIAVLQLDEFDRRFAVLEITNQSIANDLHYWEPRWDWLRQGGASIVMEYLGSRAISKSFNPHGEAPWTKAKDDMVESTHNPIDLWVSEHVLRGEPIFVKSTEVDAPLATAKELMFCYLDGTVPLHEITRRQSMSMVKALNNARARVANHGKKIKYNGVPMKYYWLGKPVQTSSYQTILDERYFFKTLVASMGNEVANQQQGGYQESDKKW